MAAPSFVGGLSRLTELTAGDLIGGNAKTIPASATMHDAAETLQRHSIGLAPVVDELGECVGVLSARDFVTFELDRTGDPPRQTDRVNVGEPAPWNSVRRFMSTAVQTVPLDAPWLSLAAMMVGGHIHHLVVLDKQSEPIGIVSTLDLLSSILAVVDEQQQRLP